MAGASETKQIMGTGTAGTAEAIVVIVFPSVNVGLFFLFLVGRLHIYKDNA